MVSSPTGRGVIIIGGRRPDHVSDTGHALIELSGDSIESLKWTFLEQKINYKRFSHTALIIPNQLVNDWALSFLPYADIMCESKCKNLASIDLYKYYDAKEHYELFKQNVQQQERKLENA